MKKNIQDYFPNMDKAKRNINVIDYLNKFPKIDITNISDNQMVEYINSHKYVNDIQFPFTEGVIYKKVLTGNVLLKNPDCLELFFKFKIDDCRNKDYINQIKNYIDGKKVISNSKTLGFFQMTVDMYCSINNDECQLADSIILKINNEKGKDVSYKIQHVKGNSDKKKITKDASIVLDTIMYLSAIVQCQKVIYKKAGRKEKNNINTTTSHYTDNKNRINVISDKKILYTIDATDEQLRQLTSTHRHLTCSFTVMGHYRHYKNGRVIWIKSYKKGNNLNTEQQTYKIKNSRG